MRTSHAADLFGGHEAGQLEHADVFLHAREGHFELVGEGGDGGVAAREPVEDATAGDVGEGSERGAEVCGRILSHLVQYGVIGGAHARGFSPPVGVFHRTRFSDGTRGFPPNWWPR